jgi:hypothetical protein
VHLRALRGLARFLDDPETQTWRYKAAQAQRSHMESSIHQSHCDLDCTTLAEGAVAFFQPPATFLDYVRKGREASTVGIELAGGDGQESWLRIQLTLSKGAPDFGPKMRLGLPNFNVRADWQTNWERERAPMQDQHSYHEVHSDRTSGEGDEVTPGAWKPTRLPYEIRDYRPASFLFCPDIARLRSPSYSPEEVPRIAADGGQLASVLSCW